MKPLSDFKCFLDLGEKKKIKIKSRENNKCKIIALWLYAVVRTCNIICEHMYFKPSIAR